MQDCRKTLLLGLTLLLATGVAVAGTGDAQQEETESIWESEARARQTPQWYDWLLDEETVKRIMKALQERDPERAAELERLREVNPQRFRGDLAIYGIEEIQEISRERSEAWRRQQLEEFLQWLKTSYPKEEEGLTKAKETDPQLYTRIIERLRDQYGPIHEAERTNPELASVLKEDLELRQRRNELLRKLRDDLSEEDRREVASELYGIVARRYDLIVRRKQIAYDQLQAKLQELQEQLETSKDEIARWQDRNRKRDNIRYRMESLLSRQRHFPWDD